MNENEHHRQYVLTMIETAQRAGLSEEEIVTTVERYLDPDPVPAQRRTAAGRAGPLGRFLGSMGKAA